ncbi:MAG TPA: glutamine-hydrolyzing carbamoyl-phosphate synthase small subunit [Acidimicrobiia bacterium]|jgi:carbamoyl-phosphate synthase small subunit|nr:glutamine-hydrolyzing carbamoyl-phosphate synthase small subunit [Acidimicrobiia bacterium]
MAREAAQLVLADGEVFEGWAVGARPPDGVVAGEVVFNTAMAGYQEIITDPSYAGQIVTFTYPHIGNYGVNADDDEHDAPFLRGIIVRDLARRPSNWRATDSLDAYLARHGVSAIAGIDTRRLTRHIRDAGAIPGAFGTADEEALLSAARADGGTDGRDLANEVTTRQPYVVGPTDARFSVVAYDFGIKASILRRLVLTGCQVEVVPASTTAEAVLGREPDGVFLSNGPGDPAAVKGAIDQVGALLGEVPVFGICLGHQIMSLALGARTFKLPFGHHGANHPVRRVADDQVEITSQNHNYAVDGASLPEGTVVTHLNLNDGDIEGVATPDRRCFSVQYHPEAGPGPHDARYLFGEFLDLMERAG